MPSDLDYIFGYKKVYKVVDKETRRGINYMIFIKSYSAKSYGERAFTELLQTYPGMWQFFPIYQKDSVVDCVSGSIGLMSYGDFYHAKRSIEIYRLERQAVIITCIAIDLFKPKPIRFYCGTSPENLIMDDMNDRRKLGCRYDVNLNSIRTHNVVFSRRIYVLE